jgi:hypothetical protein
MKFKGLIGMFFLIVQLQAQNSESDYEKNTNIGMKLGISASTMFGGELLNPTPLLGYTAGIYYHTKLDKRKFHYQTGIDLRLRGSNFNNVNDSMSNRAYTRIGLISIDVPLHALILVGNYSKDRANHIMLGIQPSYIIRSVVYLGPGKIPAQSQVYMKTWQNLPIYNLEINGLVGYQHKEEGFGYQLSLKVGLHNLNNNFKLVSTDIDSGKEYDILPITGFGKYIGTGSLEFAFIF